MRHILVFGLVSALLFSFFAPLAAHAAEDAGSFQPGLILTDFELEDWQSMNRVDIQAFLEDHGSFLVNYRTADKDNTDRDAAEIISRAASEHRINPKYILVTLQKEQGLITEKNPSEKQLDGAAGYGITDSCGWSCETYLKNKGFGKQVDSAAGIMRWYYTHPSESWIKRKGSNFTIDGTIVFAESDATGFLFTYTPHFNGNKNFWKIWREWFRQVYPDGTLVKAAQDSTVYRIRNGKKLPFKNMAALTSRFDPKLIVTAPKSELAQYETGSTIALPNYAVVKKGDEYFLIDEDTIRRFESMSVVQQLGYHPDEMIEVIEEEIAGYTKGSLITGASKPSTILVKAKETGELYIVKDHEYRSILDPAIAKVNYPKLHIQTRPIVELISLEQGLPLRLKDGALFGVKGSPKIYVIEHGKKRHIANETVFTSLGYRWEQIVWVNEFAGMIHETGQPVYATPGAVAIANETKSSKTSEADQMPKTLANGSSLQNKMIRTSKEETKIIGPIFETDVDTYLVLDTEIGAVLAGKNIDTVRPMASLAKVMVGYQLLKEGLQPNKSTTYNAKDHRAVYHRFRIVEGEKILNHDLLNAFLVSSLNTPGRMLVDSIEEDEKAFIDRMNAEAQERGLSKTVFADVTGENLLTVTTAREYLDLFQRVIKNGELRQFLGTPSYQYSELKDLDGKPDHFDDHSNILMQKNNLPFRIIASKTAYLDEAGAGLVQLIERNNDDRQFILLTMGNPDYPNRFDMPLAFAQWAIQTFSE